MDFLTGLFGFLATIGSLTAVVLAWWVWHSDNQSKRRAQAETITGWAVLEDAGRAAGADAVAKGGVVLVNSGTSAVSEVDFKATGTDSALAKHPGRRLSTLPPGSYYFRQMVGQSEPWTGPFPIGNESGRFEVSLPDEDEDVEGTIVTTLVPITAIPEQRKLVWLGFTDAAGVPWARVAGTAGAEESHEDRPQSSELPETGTSDAFSFVARLWELGVPGRLRPGLLDRSVVLPSSWRDAFEQSATTRMTQGLSRRANPTTEQIASHLREHVVVPLTGEHLAADDRARRQIPVLPNSDLGGVVTEIVTARGTGMGLTFRTPTTDASGANDVYYLAGSRDGKLPAEFWFGHLDPKKGPRTNLRAELLASARGDGKKRVEDWLAAPDDLRQAVVEVIRSHAGTS